MVTALGKEQLFLCCSKIPQQEKKKGQPKVGCGIFDIGRENRQRKGVNGIVIFAVLNFQKTEPKASLRMVILLTT